MKVCTGCKVEKTLEEFWIDKGTKSGLRSLCKSCDRAYRQSERGRKVQKKYNGTYKRRKVNRKAALKRKYGITIEDYDRRLKSQNGLCAICQTAPSKKRKLFVDHCHKTGKVRGLLCHNCNRALGMLKDSSKSAYRAAKYLDASRD